MSTPGDFALASSRGSERVNVSLASKAAAALETVVRRSATTKTDVINRALVAYAFLDEQLDAGGQLIIRRSDGREQLLQFL